MIRGRKCRNSERINKCYEEARNVRKTKIRGKDSMRKPMKGKIITGRSIT